MVCFSTLILTQFGLTRIQYRSLFLDVQYTALRSFNARHIALALVRSSDWPPTGNHDDGAGSDASLHVAGQALVQALVLLLHPLDGQDPALPQGDTCRPHGHTQRVRYHLWESDTVTVVIRVARLDQISRPIWPNLATLVVKGSFESVEFTLI